MDWHNWLGLVAVVDRAIIWVVWLSCSTFYHRLPWGRLRHPHSLLYLCIIVCLYGRWRSLLETRVMAKKGVSLCSPSDLWRPSFVLSDPSGGCCSKMFPSELQEAKLHCKRCREKWLAGIWLLYNCQERRQGCLIEMDSQAVQYLNQMTWTPQKNLLWKCCRVSWCD